MTTTKRCGDYDLISRIGEGSFAKVYRSTHVIRSGTFAVKAILREKIDVSPKFQENLESEISIMRDYLHPNIVRLYEHFVLGRYIYLVLEFCPGEDLNKFIKKRGRLDERVARGFLRQLADGLEFLNQKNLIHRDLKPANVLMSEKSDNAVLKLADFGFARRLEAAAMAATSCGTPLYMVS